MANMTMNFEFITPKKAQEILETNGSNRKISEGRVIAYANDIKDGNWDEFVGSTISIDEEGILRDGQHRLEAIIRANKGINVWICRNVSAKGIYDNNRPRSSSDQISILRPDLEGIYRTTRYIAVASEMITRISHEKTKRRVTVKEIIDFTDANKELLDGFFLIMPSGTVSKISTANVHLSLFLAYANKININNIIDFYKVLCSGMSTSPEEYPIIAYRNYLKDSEPPRHISNETIGRCQYALQKYLTKSCTRKNIAPKELIYPLHFKADEADEEIFF